MKKNANTKTTVNKSKKATVKTTRKVNVKTSIKAKVKKPLTLEELAKIQASKNTTKTVYEKRVILSNQANKLVIRTFGGVRAMILNNASEISLDKDFARILRASKKDSNLYNFLKKEVRTSKTGNYGVFYTLQSLHTKIDKINNFMDSSKKVVKRKRVVKKVA